MMMVADYYAGSPVIRSKQSGRCWTVPWNAMANIACDIDIDDQGGRGAE